MNKILSGYMSLHDSLLLQCVMNRSCYITVKIDEDAIVLLQRQDIIMKFLINTDVYELRDISQKIINIIRDNNTTISGDELLIRNHIINDPCVPLMRGRIGLSSIDGVITVIKNDGKLVLRKIDNRWGSTLTYLDEVFIDGKIINHRKYYIVLNGEVICIHNKNGLIAIRCRTDTEGSMVLQLDSYNNRVPLRIRDLQDVITLWIEDGNTL